MAPIFEGPYRIEEILDNQRGLVRLKDLPRPVHNEFHISRLKPYMSEELKPIPEDEWEVKTILGRRGSPSQREYLGWWAGYAKRDSTWENVQDPYIEWLRQVTIGARTPKQSKRKGPWKASEDGEVRNSKKW